MNTFTRMISSISRCRRSAWKLLKKSCVSPCIGRRKRPTCSDVDIIDGSVVDLVAKQTVEKKGPASSVSSKRVHFADDNAAGCLEIQKYNNKTSKTIDHTNVRIATTGSELGDCEQGQTPNDTEKKGKKKRRRAKRSKNVNSQEEKSLEEGGVCEVQESGESKPNSSLEQPAITISNIGGPEKTVNQNLTSDKDVQLNQAEKAWVPAFLKRQKAAGKTGVVEDDTTEEVIKKVRSSLNKVTPENIDVLIKIFKALPINTLDLLEKVVDLVFERAIQEHKFTPRYATLCWSLQSIQVSSTGNGQTSFKVLVVKKCQSLFQSDNDHHTDSTKKLEEINSCTDPAKKEELLLRHEENEKRFRVRSLGNCRFIGELFNRHIIQPKIMTYCVTYLLSQRSDDPLERMCILLSTIGKELEKSYNLINIIDTLKTLASLKSISLRTRFMIQDLLDLQMNKWSPKVLDCAPEVTNEKKGNVEKVKSGEIMCTRCNRSGHSAKDCCHHTGFVNNKTHKRGDKKGGGEGDIKCYKCNRIGHISRDCKEIEKCYKCDGVGHSPRNCPKPAPVFLCYNCGKNGHMARDCPEERVKRESGGINNSFICYNCNKAGHFSKDCKESRNSDGKYTVICRNCNVSGHMARDCPERKNQGVTTLIKHDD